MYKNLIKPLLFQFDPEKVHHFTFNFLKKIQNWPLIPSFTKAMFGVNNPKLAKTVMGINFPNPVGLAAGFDKDAKLFKELSNFGFGFIEIGTLTPKPQAGNDKPRLFRLPADEALINRMGFNNQGVEVAAARLKNKGNIIVGGNIGKNKVTPNEKALEDYIYCFNALYDYVDYFVVNVSSPNTPGLRELQEKEPLLNLLHHLQELNQKKSKPKPILLKIAPDLTFSQLDDIVEIVVQSKIAGVIASNTTIDRSNLKTSSKKIENIGAGGLSGQPVKNKSNEVLKYLVKKSGKSFVIIAVGGIHSSEDALEKLKLGADLIQIYTGFIYEGPSLVKRINKAILNN